jgi:hypothetical protein
MFAGSAVELKSYVFMVGVRVIDWDLEKNAGNGGNLTDSVWPLKNLLSPATQL